LLAAQKLAEQSTLQAAMGFVSSASHQVASQFMTWVSAGQSLLFPSIQQTAQQSAIQTTANSALGIVSGGVATLGISLGIQAGVSIASSIISSSWKI
jgi:hypothetical protein